MSKHFIIAICMCACVFAFTANAQASVVNGGFEDGFNGWQTSQMLGGNVAVVSGYTFEDGTTVQASEGTSMAMVGMPVDGANWNIFNQVMQVDTITERYLSFDYNFWSYDYAPYDENGFQVLVNGRSVLSLSPEAFGKETGDESLQMTGWQTMTLDLAELFPQVMGFGTFSVAFMGGDTSDYDLKSGVFLDNVSATPIPGAFWLLGSGLLGLVGMRRRMN